MLISLSGTQGTIPDYNTNINKIIIKYVLTKQFTINM